MRRIVETTATDGLESLMGEQVLLLCGNYLGSGSWSA